MMKSQSLDSAAAAVGKAQLEKFNQISELNAKLQKGIEAIEKVFSQKDLHLNSKLPQFVENSVIYHQTTFAQKTFEWGVSDASPIVQWIKIQPQPYSVTIEHIWQSWEMFLRLRETYSSFVGQICWYEQRGFDVSTPWTPEQGTQVHIEARWKKTKVYAQQMKQALDPLNQLSQQFAAKFSIGEINHKTNS